MTNQSAELGWSKKKPTKPGVYGIRGFNLFRPKSGQVEAIVRVCRHGRKLVCNLHETNSDPENESWSWVSDISRTFEWREYVVKESQP